jgi:hypothetical protein
MAKTLVIALLGVGCLPFAGCGGSASSSSPAGSASSSSPAGSASASTRYLAAGNAICTKQLAQLNKLAQPTSAEQAVSYLPKALLIMRRETSGLTALDPPAPERAQVAAGLASAQQLAALLRRFLHELRGGLVEIGTFGRVQTQTGALRADVNAHFRLAGLTRCTG